MENMRAARSPENAILMLKDDRFDLIDIQKFGRSQIIRLHIVANHEFNAVRVIIAFIDIIHGDGGNLFGCGYFQGQRLTKIMGKSGDSTFARKIISDHRNCVWMLYESVHFPLLLICLFYN